MQETVVTPDISSILSQKFSKRIKKQLSLKIGKYSNGSIRNAYFEYHNYMIEGEFKSFFRNGNLKEHFFKKNGADIGEYKSYHSNGNLKEQYHVTPWNGRHGEYKRFAKNKQLLEHCFYKDDEYHGKYISYYYGGKIKESYNYKEGECHGLCEEYNEKGHLTRKYTCKFGKLHGEFLSYNKFTEKYEHSIYNNDVALNGEDYLDYIFVMNKICKN